MKKGEGREENGGEEKGKEGKGEEEKLKEKCEGKERGMRGALK